MSTRDKIVEWAKRMGYQGQIPSDFKNVCNASNEHIWLQIIEKVKPRQEIEHVKRNLIMHRLSSANKDSKIQYDTPNEAIDVWKKKRHLQKSIEAAQESIKSKRTHLDEVSKENKALYLRIEEKENSIRESQRKTYMYERKSEHLRNEIAFAEEKLMHIRNLTPIEAGDEKDVRDVSDDLKLCAEKLRNFVSECGDISNFPQEGGHCASFLGETDICSSRNIQSLASLCRTPASVSKVFRKERPISHMDQELHRLRKEEMLDIVEDVLCKYNRAETWNALRSIENDLKFGLEKFLVHNSLINTSSSMISKKDHITELHCIHIEHELEALKWRTQAKVLEKRILEQKAAIMDKLLSEGCTTFEASRILEQVSIKAEEVATDVAKISMFKQIEEYRNRIGSSGELLILQSELRQLQMDIGKNIKVINNKLQFFKHSQNMMLSKKDETYWMVAKLNRIVQDMSWLTPLGEPYVIQEVELLNEVCLDFMRQFTFNCKNVGKYLREFPTISLPCGKPLDSSELCLLASLDIAPSRFPSSVLVNILQDKHDLNVWRSNLSLPKIFYSKCSITDLTSQESYLGESIDKLIELARGRNVLGIKVRSENRLQFWHDMPVKDYLLPTRTFEGHDYKHYEELYNMQYSKLQPIT